MENLEVSNLGSTNRPAGILTLDFRAQMDVGEGSSSGALAKDQIIQAGHTVLLRVPNGEIRTQKLEKNSSVIPYILLILLLFNVNTEMSAWENMVLFLQTSWLVSRTA